MNIEIKRMTISDYDEVIKLWESNENIGLSTSDSKHKIENFLVHNKDMSFIAKTSNNIIGAVLCGTDGRRGYIHHLTVNKKYQKQGIGKKLVNKCIDNIRELGLEKIHIFVFKENIEGQKFWQKMGWKSRDDLVMFSYKISFE